MESDGNTLESGELVWNDIYTYTVHTKSCFYDDPCERQKSMSVLMKTVAIFNIDYKFCTRKHILPQGKYLFSFIQAEIGVQRTFEHKNIGYYKIKD